MRRGLVGLLATGVVLGGSVAAAAAASGDNPTDLLRAKPAKNAVQRPRANSSVSSGHATSTAPRRNKAAAKKAEDQADDEDRDSKTGTTSQKPAAHRVMLCHHPGSWTHPFDALGV